VEEWHTPKKTASKRVRYRSQTRTRRMTECSTSDSLCDVSWIQKAALQLYRRNVPLLQTSRYVIAHDSCSFTRPSPALVLHVTNAWVRRPGYEANAYPLVSQVHLAHSQKVMKPLVTSGHWVFGYDLVGQHAEETSRKAKQR